MTAMVRRLRGAAALAALVTMLGAFSWAAVPTARADSGSNDLPLLHAVAGKASGGSVVDANDRQVQLNGVNVNSLGDYWRPNKFPATFPFTAKDADTINGIGWNVVRLVLSWSKIEPKPGQYDDAYLQEASRIVSMLADRGVYTIVDLHQDAWGKEVAATSSTKCTKAYPDRNLGWDGAPEWATLALNKLHCHLVAREYSPVVKGSWDAFFANDAGPGGVGIRTRFVNMWHHVAEHFAGSTSVAAFDVLNEPGSLTQENHQGLNKLYADAVRAIRAGEHDSGGARHMILLEPSVLFSGTGNAPAIKPVSDDDIAFGPHIYTGSVRDASQPPDKDWFSTAAKLAREAGGVPVINGEWGGGTGSTKPVSANFFHSYQALTDKYGFSAAFWLYKQSCGDPHAIRSHEKYAAGLYVVPCSSNDITGMRTKMVNLLSRPYPRAVAGQTRHFSFAPDTRTAELTYAPGKTDAATEIAVPKRRYPDGYRVQAHGAQVVSGSGAAVLRLRNDAGASTVTATVIPAGASFSKPAGNRPTGPSGGHHQITQVPSGAPETGAGATAGADDVGLLAGGLAALALAGAALLLRRRTAPIRRR